MALGTAFITLRNQTTSLKSFVVWRKSYIMFNFYFVIYQIYPRTEI